MRSHTDFLPSLLALLLTVLLLASCAPAAETQQADVRAILEAVAASQEDLPELETLTDASADFDQTASRVYGLDPDTIEEAVVSYAGGTEADEIIILRCTSAEAAREAASALEEYASGREAVFTGYVPAQAAEVAAREVVQEGSLVVLLIVPDPQNALAAVNEAPQGTAAVSSAEQTAAASSETPAASSEETQETYDHDAVLQAVKSGDTEGLSEGNRQVAELVRDAIASEIDPSMTDYEKEKAVHDWIIRYVEYDPAAVEHPLTLQDPIENHENPLGALLGGGAICYGYSSTFQLFMDALGIPCITVDGAAYNEEEAHSWNLVELDGQWYYVDVTWDDPLGARPTYTYFNVPASVLEAYGPHIWDASALPETAAQPYEPS